MTKPEKVKLRKSGRIFPKSRKKKIALKKKPLPKKLQDGRHRTQKIDLKPPLLDKKALDLSKRYKVFGKKTPTFLLADTKLVEEAE